MLASAGSTLCRNPANYQGNFWLPAWSIYCPAWALGNIGDRTIIKTRDSADPNHPSSRIAQHRRMVKLKAPETSRHRGPPRKPLFSLRTTSRPTREVGLAGQLTKGPP